MYMKIKTGSAVVCCMHSAGRFLGGLDPPPAAMPYRTRREAVATTGGDRCVKLNFMYAMPSLARVFALGQPTGQASATTSELAARPLVYSLSFTKPGDGARSRGGRGGPAAGEEVESRPAVRVEAHGARRHPQHDHRCGVHERGLHRFFLLALSVVRRREKTHRRFRRFLKKTKHEICSNSMVLCFELWVARRRVYGSRLAKRSSRD